jgi:hypothetical protein
MNRSLALLVLGLTLTVAATAHRPKIMDGTLASLKGVTELNIQFVYADMCLGPEGKTEADYLKRREEELNMRDPGKGTQWARDWIDDRSRLYEPAFMEHFNKMSKGIQLLRAPGAKYTMIFKTIHTEPGFNAVVVDHAALITAEVFIVETANPAIPLCRIFLKDSKGEKGTDFDFSRRNRIQGSYIYAGYSVGRLFARKLD